VQAHDAAAGDARCDGVLDFWFGAHADDANVVAERSPMWFRGGADVDASIRLRFGALRELAIAGELDDWLASARARLALVILVDQFSRNLFRLDARAFAHDALARRWCEQGLDSGADQSLRPIERVFLYLPLEHSESLTDQRRSVALFEALHDDASSAMRETFATYLDYARRHRDIIARFGRFPHRNEVLGRPSTAQETQFLASPGSSF
jgi:uncharacterized protein (DUF924 family)